LAGVAAVGRSAVNGAAVERGADAQIAADLDAGIGARDLPESGTIQGADPYVFDRFGLDGKVGCLCPLMAIRPAAEPSIRLLTNFMLNFQVALSGKVPDPLGDDTLKAGSLVPVKPALKFPSRLRTHPRTARGLKRRS
jgi:hypothetical protein